MKKMLMILVVFLAISNLYSETPLPKVESSGSIVTTTVYGYPLHHQEGCIGDNGDICNVYQKVYPSPDPSDYGEWSNNSKINFFAPSIGVSTIDSNTPGLGFIDALLNAPLSIPGTSPYPSPNYRIDGNTQTFNSYSSWYNALPNSVK